MVKFFTTMFLFFAMATAVVSAQQVVPTASEQTKMHWAVGQQCVDYYNTHAGAPAYVPATPYHERKLGIEEAILPLPYDAEGCYKQPLPGGVHEWVIRLKDDPTEYEGALARADGRCFNVFEGRILFHTTPAPAPIPAPAAIATQPAPMPRELEYQYNLAVLLAKRENCSNPGPLLDQAQRDPRKKNLDIDIQYDMNGCVVKFSDHNFKDPKPAGSGFWGGVGRFTEALLAPAPMTCDMYGRCYPVYNNLGGSGFNTYYGGGRGGYGGGHRGGGGHNTGGDGGQPQPPPIVNTGGSMARGGGGGRNTSF